jgi:hypothetical protein
MRADFTYRRCQNKRSHVTNTFHVLTVFYVIKHAEFNGDIFIFI